MIFAWNEVLLNNDVCYWQYQDIGKTYLLSETYWLEAFSFIVTLLIKTSLVFIVL